MDFNEIFNIPDNFLTKRWPNPRLRGNSPVASDQALSLFMDEMYDTILEEDGLDIDRIRNRDRYS